jgi:hypothetical protein
LTPYCQFAVEGEVLDGQFLLRWYAYCLASECNLDMCNSGQSWCNCFNGSCTDACGMSCMFFGLDARILSLCIDSVDSVVFVSEL